MRVSLLVLGVLFLPACRTLDPALLQPVPFSLPVHLPALTPQVSLQYMRPRGDSATVARDIKVLLSQELREILTTPADSAQGVAVLNVRRVRYRSGQIYSALSGFSFCSLNLLGLPFARFYCLADVQLDIRNRHHELVGTYYAQGEGRQTMGLYYRPWYSEATMTRLVYVQAVRQALTQLLPQLQAELPELRASLAD